MPSSQQSPAKRPEAGSPQALVLPLLFHSVDVRTQGDVGNGCLQVGPSEGTRVSGELSAGSRLSSPCGDPHGLHSGAKPETRPWGGQQCSAESPRHSSPLRAVPCPDDLPRSWKQVPSLSSRLSGTMPTGRWTVLSQKLVQRHPRNPRPPGLSGKFLDESAFKGSLAGKTKDKARGKKKKIEFSVLGQSTPNHSTLGSP